VKTEPQLRCNNKNCTFNSNM